MVVTVYARHSIKCPHKKGSNAGQYRRCKCPLWLRWGKNHKRSAQTRSWEIANKAARKPEQELENQALGVDLFRKPKSKAKPQVEQGNSQPGPEPEYDPNCARFADWKAEKSQWTPCLLGKCDCYELA